MSEYKQEEKTLEELLAEEPTVPYSYADYLKWTFDERVELIKGKIFDMSPAPTRKHQEIGFIISNEIYNYLKGKPCKAYYAPFDVRLPNKKGDPDDKIYTVVQPDIMVICNQDKLDEKGCVGAPDLIVEILSPSTAKKDLTIKRELYEENGVKEYWVIYPKEEIVEVFTLAEGKYNLPQTYVNLDKIQVHTLPGLEIDLKEVF